MGHQAADDRHDELFDELIRGRADGSLTKERDARILDLMSRVWYRMTDGARERARAQAREWAHGQ